MISVDTNLLIYAADPDSPKHERSRAFLEPLAQRKDFALCELVLIELYKSVGFERLWNPLLSD